METRTPFGKPGSSATLKRDNRPIRVMIVDDALTVRTIFSRMVNEAPDMQVVSCEKSAENAIATLRRTPADVVLLDLEMPGMGGLDALPQILQAGKQAAVLVVSSLTQAGAEHTVAALSMGAADTMLKPRSGGFDMTYRADLLDKIRAIGMSRIGEPEVDCPLPTSTKRMSDHTARIIAVGASTGGIHALNVLLRNLDPTFETPICITQHLPSAFMPIFARQIEEISARRTLVAEDGTIIRPGQIVLASGDAHLLVERRGTRFIARHGFEKVQSGCLPSVDPMLRSIGEACDGQACGVILSGMGRDGVHGAEALVRLGGRVIAQDAESSAVWGMPGAVVSSGLATAVLSPAAIGDALMQGARVS